MPLLRRSPDASSTLRRLVGEAVATALMSRVVQIPECPRSPLWVWVRRYDLAWTVWEADAGGISFSAS
jgi:hypothetical protein